MPVWDALGPKWAHVCKTTGTAFFIWAHNGTNRNGYVELLEGGKLETPWCDGSWAVCKDDPDVVEMNFGSSRHMCRIQVDGSFTVEEKFLLRTGKASYKP